MGEPKVKEAFWPSRCWNLAAMKELGFQKVVGPAHVKREPFAIFRTAMAGRSRRSCHMRRRRSHMIAIALGVCPDTVSARSVADLANERRPVRLPASVFPAAPRAVSPRGINRILFGFYREEGLTGASSERPERKLSGHRAPILVEHGPQFARWSLGISSIPVSRARPSASACSTLYTTSPVKPWPRSRIPRSRGRRVRA